MIPKTSDPVSIEKDEEKPPPFAWFNLACIAAVANLGRNNHPFHAPDDKGMSKVQKYISFLSFSFYSLFAPLSNTIFVFSYESSHELSKTN